MLKKILGGLLALVVLFVGGVYFLSGRALGAEPGAPLHDMAVEVPAADDSLALAEGERFVTIFGCADCHGEDLGGKLFIDAPPFFVLHSANLTGGTGGTAALADPRLFERALRHGVGPEGDNLIIMPSHEYNGMTDQEVAQLLGYLRTVPPVDRTPEPVRFGPMGRFFSITTDEIVPASLVDNEAPHVRLKEEGISPEWGARFGKGCTGCHGSDYAGGVKFEQEDGTIVVSVNITQHADGIGGWTQQQFSNAIRNGVRPDGSAIATTMPWQGLSRLTDDEVESLWMFIRTLEPVEGN